MLTFIPLRDLSLILQSDFKEKVQFLIDIVSYILSYLGCLSMTSTLFYQSIEAVSKPSSQWRRSKENFSSPSYSVCSLRYGFDVSQSSFPHSCLSLCTSQVRGLQPARPSVGKCISPGLRLTRVSDDSLGGWDLQSFFLQKVCNCQWTMWRNYRRKWTGCAVFERMSEKLICCSQRCYKPQESQTSTVVDMQVNLEPCQVVNQGSPEHEVWKIVSAHTRRKAPPFPENLAMTSRTGIFATGVRL